MSDLIIIPELDDPGVITKQAEVRLRRHVDHQMQRGGLRAVMRMKRVRAYLRMARMAAARGSMGSRVSRAMGMGRAAMANPAMAVATLLAALGVVAIRLFTDKPFETWGYEIEEFLLGDTPLEARAGMRARESLLRTTGSRSAAIANDPYLQKRFNMLASMEVDQLRGERRIRQEIGVNGIADIAVVKSVEAIATGRLHEFGIPDKMRRTRNRLDEINIYAPPFMYR